MSLGAMLSLLLLIAADALTPQLFRWEIDQGIAKKDLDIVFQASSSLICVAIARGVSSFGQSFWAEAVAQGVAYKLRNQIFQKIHNLSFSYHDRAPTSQLLTRITSDIEKIRTFVSTTLLQVISLSPDCSHDYCDFTSYELAIGVNYTDIYTCRSVFVNRAFL